MRVSVPAAAVVASPPLADEEAARERGRWRLGDLDLRARLEAGSATEILALLIISSINYNCQQATLKPSPFASLLAPVSPPFFQHRQGSWRCSSFAKMAVGLIEMGRFNSACAAPSSPAASGSSWRTGSLGV